MITAICSVHATAGSRCSSSKFSPIPEVLAALRNTDGVTVHEQDHGKAKVSISGYVSKELEYEIVKKLPESERAGFAYAAAKYRRDTGRLLSPAERGEPFVVPRLLAHIQGELEFADPDLFMEYHNWSLLDHSPKLAESEFDVRETAHTFQIDLDGKSISYQYATEEEQLALNVIVEGWTPQALVIWLDRQTRQADIGQGELLRWLSDLVGHLIDDRNMHMAALMRCKFILARKIRSKIAAIRQQERKNVYKQYLFAPEAGVEVSFDSAFKFQDRMYWDAKRYRGPWKPLKHFLEYVPAFDGAPDGEEFQCAQALDSLEEVTLLVAERCATSGFVLAPHCDRQVLPGLRRAVEGRSTARRGIQRCARHQEPRYAREADNRRALGAQKRQQRSLHCRGEEHRRKRYANTVGGEGCVGAWGIDKYPMHCGHVATFAIQTYRDCWGPTARGGPERRRFWSSMPDCGITLVISRHLAANGEAVVVAE